MSLLLLFGRAAAHNLAATVTDPAGLLDGVTRALASGRTPTDPATLHDAATAIAALARTPANQLGLSDTVAFLITGAEGEHIFTTQVPALHNANDNADYTLGTVFVPAVNGRINGIRWWAPQQGEAGRVALLYRWDSDTTGTELARVNFVTTIDDAWNYTSFAAPVNVTAGQRYVAAMYINRRYVATGGLFNGAAITSGDLTAPADSTTVHNGKFVSSVGAPAYPSDSFGGGGYFVDVDFMAAGAGQNYNLTLTDALGPVDATQHRLAFAVTVANALGLIDASQHAANLAVAVDDPLGLADTSRYATQRTVEFVDQLGVTDPDIHAGDGSVPRPSTVAVGRPALAGVLRPHR